MVRSCSILYNTYILFTLVIEFNALKGKNYKLVIVAQFLYHKKFL